jgi:sugar phosphate isomerase/epimerase
VRFGLCCSSSEADAALDAGFDYVELPASRLADEIEIYKRLRPPATNLFFPAGVSLYDSGRPHALKYAKDVVKRARDVGVQTMVIGSGGARKAPDRMRPSAAETEFVLIAAEISESAEKVGIIIAPESLNRSETNVGNDLRSFSTALREHGVAYTADSYHVISEFVAEGGEGPIELEHWEFDIPYLPAHVHLGGRDRVDPLASDPDLAGFVRRLLDLGYDGRVSLESSRRAGWNLAESLRQMRSLFA